MTSFSLGNSFPAEASTQSIAFWRAAVSSHLA